MIRVFVAISMPPQIKDRLTRLCTGLPGARWLPPENMHLTLRFLGETSEADMDSVQSSLRLIEVPSFSLVLDGIGTFGQGHRTRAIWVGVETSPDLRHLQSKIETSLVRAGFPPEHRKFTPHITLARFRNALPRRIMQFVEANALFRAGPFPVERFAMFRSQLGKGGSVYNHLASYDLALRTRR